MVSENLHPSNRSGDRSAPSDRPSSAPPMPKAASEKCRLCSKLAIAQVSERHGPSGSNCWIGEPCHKRRSYYRNRELLVRSFRYNASKRQQYRGVAVEAEVDDGKGTVLTVVPAIVPAAVLYLYRARVDDPLHAIGAELWLGQSKVAQIEPVHTMGLMPAQIKVFLKEILTAFSGQVPGVNQFEVQKELSPDCCPIRPCPLHL
jgi:hypothetical protein